MKKNYILCAAALMVLTFHGCGSSQGQSAGDTTNSQTPASMAESTESQSDASISGTGAADNAASEKITPETAKSTALSHAGLSEDQVTFVKCDLETEDGRQIYEVEFYTADQTEYDYDIDAYSGEILSHDYDAEDYLPPDSADNGSLITEEQAKELALAKVPGASASDIREFETDYEDGRTEYEGKIIYNGMEYEFEIDGSNGTFRSWEKEPAD